MSRSIQLDSDGNDITCMKNFDALKYPCRECDREDCDEREEYKKKMYSQMNQSNEIVATGSWLIYSNLNYINGRNANELKLLRETRWFNGMSILWRSIKVY